VLVVTCSSQHFRGRHDCYKKNSPGVNVYVYVYVVLLCCCRRKYTIHKCLQSITCWRSVGVVQGDNGTKWKQSNGESTSVVSFSCLGVEHVRVLTVSPVHSVRQHCQRRRLWTVPVQSPNTSAMYRHVQMLQCDVSVGDQISV